MADGAAEEISQTLGLGGGDSNLEGVAAAAATGGTLQQDMDLENPSSESQENDGDHPKGDQNPPLKRAREEDNTNGTEDESDAVSKKLKPDNSVEEKRLEEIDQKGEEVEEEKQVTEVEKEPPLALGGAVFLGPKTFSSSMDMFDYFFKLLHYWQPNIDINEYEHMVLLDLLKKGHLEPDRKLGSGVHAFQVRYHPLWKSRCFFLVREDGFADDFSFRKCVDKILPLPENMKAPANKDGGQKTGGHKKGGRGGHVHGRRGGFRK